VEIRSREGERERKKRSEKGEKREKEKEDGTTDSREPYGWSGSQG
jgi:hypothetical protein